MNWLLLGTMLPSFAISLIACYLIRASATRIGLVDEPGHRKVHDSVTPLGGGLAIWLGVIVTFTVGTIVAWQLIGAADPPAEWARLTGWFNAPPLPSFVFEHLDGVKDKTRELWTCLGAATVLMVLGLLDDLRGLRWQTRIAVEIIAASFVVWSGVSFTLYIDFPWITAPLSVLWIVALINSFNFLDNMDGLSGGIATITAASLAAVLMLNPYAGHIQTQLFVAGFLLVFIGALLGFLWHNKPRAKLFMGDAGSYFIGFYLAIATMLATYSGESLPWHAVLTPLCIFAVPLYDMATVLYIRLSEGRSPFHADKSHFSHRLVELGMTKTEAVLTIYLLTATCGLSAYVLRQVEGAGAVTTLLVVLCVLMLVLILETVGRRGKK